ncbi:hypothetical protein [Nocardia aurantiaca]
MDDDFTAEQQHAADLFFTNGLIDRQIPVADAIVPEIDEIVRALPPK